MTGPLAGLRVVDCSTGTAGPRATGMLADYGAEVIWVEPPGGDGHRAGLAIPYSVFNRGKRSVALDLKDAGGRARMLELLATADVFVESWRPGVAERLGLGRTELRDRFPALVHTSITGFGPDGPHRDLPGFESLVHAIVGSTGEQAGHRDGPIYQALPFASIGAADLALIGTLGALYRRGQDGHGRHVETSLLDGALSFLAMTWGDSDNESLTPPIQPGSIRLVSRTYRCADDEYLGVHTAAVGAFGRLIRVLDLQDRIPTAEDGTDMRIPLTPEQSKIVMEEIPEIFLTEPRAVWLERLLKADICAIPALRPGEVFDEPQPRHNEMVVEVVDPVLGPVQQVAPPAKFPENPALVGDPAPEVGQHTVEVLAELAAGSRPGPQSPSGEADADRPLLAGLKVLDLGAYYAGPYSSRLLADLGADVIKLETTLGDQLRGIARPFRSAQAGKRGISLNLKDPELAPALQGLIRWADVICHNMRPGAAERLGIGYEQVRQLNPAAVYLYAPGWGSSGPDSQRQSFAPMLSGYAGISHEVAGQYNEPLFPLGNEDPGNGLLGAVGAMMALVQRQQTGRGQYVENSQLNATMAHMAHVVRTPDGTVLGAMRLDPLQTGFHALDRLYETADGWIAVAVTGDADVARLGEVVGLPLGADERFATAEARAEHDDELYAELGDAFFARTTQEWVGALTGAGLGAAVPASENNSRAFHRDPENHRTGRVVQVDHPVQGVVRELAHLMRVSDAARAEHRLAPELGEHTEEVLAELGYGPEQLAALEHRGSIRVP
jgi:crotonobetainyl-CoA:carnitine CoA-transferase CaiB-like acyl-CoA transferase